MRLYFDNIIFYLQNFGGISAYWKQLVADALDHSDIDARFIEPANLSPKFNDKPAFTKELIIRDRKLPLPLLRYLPPNSHGFGDDSIFHSSYFRYCTNKKVKNVITVYDFTYEYYVRGLAKNIHHWQKSLAINKAAGIICISENTKSDLLNFFPGLDKNKIKVIYLSADDNFHKISGLSILDTRFKDLAGKKIISFVGKRAIYKNFSLAIEILKLLSSEYHLLIIGGGEFSSEEERLLRSVSGRFSQLSAVSPAELNIVYNISFCYLYPSEYEGFGIPILEAMRAGCPVLCQYTSSIPEVYGQVDNIVRRLNAVEEFYANIRKLEDENFRKKIIEQGLDNAGRFSWSKTCHETLDFYRFLS